MRCVTIMTPDPLTVDGMRSVATAAGLLLGHQKTHLAVLDANGRHIGMFGLDDLSSMLVPRMALAGDVTANLRFITDDPGDLRARFGEFADRPVSEFVDRNAPTLKPDASAMEAFRLVCRSGRPIAVIAHDSGKFEGIITYLDAFRGLIHASS